MGQELVALSRSINRQAHRQNLKYGACRVGKDKRQLAILAVLKFLAKKYGKGYSFPTQETILEKLEAFHDITMSRRTLNRDLDELRDAGAIQSYRRTKRVPSMGRRYTSTAYYVMETVKRFVASIRKSLRYLDLARVPNSAHNGPCLRKENSYEADPPVPDGPQIQRFAPPGQVPEFIPG